MAEEARRPRTRPKDPEPEAEPEDDGPEEDEEPEEDELAGPVVAPERRVYSSWGALCDAVEGEIASHYRYARFTGKRMRFCEKGKFFSLDADEDDPSAYPRPLSGDYRVQLYRAERGTEGRPVFQPVDPDPEDSSVQLAVCFRGQLPADKPPPPPPEPRPENLDKAHLRAYTDRVDDIRALNKILRKMHEDMEEYREKGWKEADKQRKAKKKAKKKVRELQEELSGGVVNRVFTLLENAVEKHGVKGLLQGGQSVVSNLAGLGPPGFTPPKND